MYPLKKVSWGRFTMRTKKKRMFNIMLCLGRWLRRSPRSLRSSVSQTSSTFSTQTLNHSTLLLATELRWEYCADIRSVDYSLVFWPQWFLKHAGCLCYFRMSIPIRRWAFHLTGFSLSILRGSWCRSMPKQIFPRKLYA